jgi:hypothetical protein
MLVGEGRIGNLDAQLSNLGGNIWLANDSDDVVRLDGRAGLGSEELCDNTSATVDTISQSAARLPHALALMVGVVVEVVVVRLTCILLHR